MYSYPVPIVRVLLVKNNKVLLLKRSEGKYGRLKWVLPGGKVKYSQTIEDACTNEVKEETNLDINSLIFLFYQNSLPVENNQMHCINFCFSAEFNGELYLNNESTEYKWICFNDIPKYNIAFSNEKAINKYYFELANKK